jgi:amylovoran biosynthesis glycosyltransferase AmsE
MKEALHSDLKCLISVLMSCYKGDKSNELKEAILSVSLYQTFSPDEIILIIDGPVGEDLNATIKELQSLITYLKVFRLQKNVGLGRALNFGLKKCKNEVIARMDSDDISSEVRFEKQIEHMERNSLDILSCYIEEFSRTNKRIRRVPLEHTAICRALPHKSPFNHMGVMFKKSKILAVGGYQDLYFKEDASLWIRLLFGANAVKVGNLSDVLVRARFDEATICRRRGWKYLNSEYKLLRLYLSRLGHFEIKSVMIFLFRTVPSRLAPKLIVKLLYKLDRHFYSP